MARRADHCEFSDSTADEFSNAEQKGLPEPQIQTSATPMEGVLEFTLIIRKFVLIGVGEFT